MSANKWPNIDELITHVWPRLAMMVKYMSQHLSTKVYDGPLLYWLTDIFARVFAYERMICVYLSSHFCKPGCPGTNINIILGTSAWGLGPLGGIAKLGGGVCGFKYPPPRRFRKLAPPPRRGRLLQLPSHLLAHPCIVYIEGWSSLVYILITHVSSPLFAWL